MTWMGQNANETLLWCSLSPPTLRDSMRCPKALSAIEVMAGSRDHGKQKVADFLVLASNISFLRQRRWAHLYSYTSAPGIPSVGPVPV